MSLDDYINRQPIIPPKIDWNEQQSSLDVDYPPLDPGRIHITASVPSSRPANSTIPRFSLGYWAAMQTGDAVATVLPSGTERLALSAEIRTNKDRVGLLWSSKDTLAHQITSYVENVNYQNVVLAFQHDTLRPDQFTATITNSAGTFIYRLAPYGFNATTNKYECLDKRFNTNRTYPASVYDNTKPGITLVPYAGRTDYIFILDFNDLRQGHDFKGAVIDQRKISSIVLDVLPLKHALGSSAFVARVIQEDEGQCRMELGGVSDTAKINPGDVITGLLTYVANNESQFTVNTSWTVISSSGFGSSNRSLLVQGTMPGGFIDFPVMYARDLQEASVVAVSTQNFLFGNFTVTGTGTRTMGKRTYSQAVNGLSMVSDLDDQYTIQPKRLVDSVVALGYRQDWTLSLGSKSYYKGSTTLQKSGDTAITDSQSHEWPVLYAGESQLNGHYVVGRAPVRGVDKLHDDVTTEWSTRFAGIMAFNGTTKNSSAERSAMPVGGSYWWDLELDVPGPAATNAVAAMRGRTPKGIVWCLGDSDAIAIEEPGSRSPVPTIARAKLATEKVFAYFRSLWGASLPIWIQEQAWGWGPTTPVDPEDPDGGGPIQKGAPTYLNARRNYWGDLVLRWKSYGVDPALCMYRVEIYNPVKIGQVITSFTVPGTQEEDGYVYADWAVEQNVPIRALIDNALDDWGGLRWRVIGISALGEVPSQTKSGLVPVDNSIVKKMIVMGPNAYLGGYFTFLSDSATNGRKDHEASGTMRRRYAADAGLRNVQVTLLDISKDHGFILMDWWKDGAPGTALTEATTKIASTGLPVAHVAMGNPGETEQLYSLPEGQWQPILDNYRQANIDMLAWMRTHWGNPDLEMWFQGATSVWQETPLQNINATATKRMRDLQSQMCLDDIGFLMGSYVPGGLDPANYLSFGGQRRYFTVSTYHAAAQEMGESMAKHIDRAFLDPVIGCEGCSLEDSYQVGQWVVTSENPDEPGSQYGIQLYSADYFMGAISRGETGSCADSLNFITSFLNQKFNSGAVPTGTTLNLDDVDLGIISMSGTTGGFSVYFTLLYSDGTNTNAGYFTYVNENGVITRENHLTVHEVTFGEGPGQILSLGNTTPVTIGDTVSRITMPPIDVLTVLDANCMLCNLRPDCPINPDPEDGFAVGDTYFSNFIFGNDTVQDDLPFMAFKNSVPIDSTTWNSGPGFLLAKNDVLRQYVYWDKKKFDESSIQAELTIATWMKLDSPDIEYPVTVQLDDSGEFDTWTDLLFALVPTDGSEFQTWTDIASVVLDRPGQFVYQTKLTKNSPAFLGEVRMTRKVIFTDANDLVARMPLTFAITACRLTETYSFPEVPEIEQTSSGFKLINGYSRVGISDSFAKGGAMTIEAKNLAGTLLSDGEIAAGSASFTQSVPQVGSSPYATWNIQVSRINESTPVLTAPVRMAPPSSGVLAGGIDSINSWVNSQFNTFMIGSNNLIRIVDDTTGTHTATSSGVTELNTFDRRVSRIGATRNLTWGIAAPAGKQVRSYKLLDKVDPSGTNDDHNYNKIRYYQIAPESSLPAYPGTFTNAGQYEEFISSSGLNCRESFREGSTQEVSSSGGSTTTPYAPTTSITVPISWTGDGTPSGFYTAEGSTAVNEWRGPIPNVQQAMVLAANAGGYTRRLTWGGNGFVYALRIIGKFEDPTNS